MTESLPTSPSVNESPNSSNGVLGLIARAKEAIAKLIKGEDPSSKPRVRRDGEKPTGEMVVVEIGMVNGPNKTVVYDRGSLMPAPPPSNVTVERLDQRRG